MIFDSRLRFYYLTTLARVIGASYYRENSRQIREREVFPGGNLCEVRIKIECGAMSRVEARDHQLRIEANGEFLSRSVTFTVLLSLNIASELSQARRDFHDPKMRNFSMIQSRRSNAKCYRISRNLNHDSQRYVCERRNRRALGAGTDYEYSVGTCV